MLLDVESKEVETYVSLAVHQRVSDARFAGLQFQTHVSEPLVSYLLDLFDGGLVAVHHDEVIGISANDGLPSFPFPILVDLAGKRREDGCFKSAQGHIGKHWRERPALWNSFWSRKQFTAVEDACLEPCLD